MTDSVLQIIIGIIIISNSSDILDNIYGDVITVQPLQEFTRFRYDVLSSLNKNSNA